MMTREEAKEIFLNRGYIEVEGGTIFDGDKWREACSVISKWLEQEPCDDAVSRQALQTALLDEELDQVQGKSGRELCQIVEALPPVHPKEKVGEWIVEKYRKCLPFDSGIGFTEDEEYDEKTHTVVSERTVCNKCRYKLKSELDKTNFCPNCGAKMQDMVKKRNGVPTVVRR